MKVKNWIMITLATLIFVVNPIVVSFEHLIFNDSAKSNLKEFFIMCAILTILEVVLIYFANIFVEIFFIVTRKYYLYDDVMRNFLLKPEPDEEELKTRKRIKTRNNKLSKI